METRYGAPSISSILRPLTFALSAAPTVGQWMTPVGITIRPETTLLDALTTMLSERLSFLPVLDADGRPVGLLTQLQVVQSFASVELRGAERAAVSDVMTVEFLSVSDSQPVARVAQRLRDERRECVLVVGRSGECVGTLAEADFLRAALERRSF